MSVTTATDKQTRRPERPVGAHAPALPECWCYTVLTKVIGPCRCR